MLNHLAKCPSSNYSLIFSPLAPLSSGTGCTSSPLHTATAQLVPPPSAAIKSEARRQVLGRRSRCGARRRVIYDDEEEEDEEEYGYNEELALLETYTLSMKDEVLLVEAIVDEETVEVIIFKGFSSCLSYKTSPDPTRSVLPKRAVIKNIDRVRGPFNPSDIQYIQKGFTFNAFKNRLQQH